MAKLKRSKRSKSHLSRNEFYLDLHDEEKALMFATGIVLGVGLSATLLGIFVYGGIALVAIALVLLYIEQRQKKVYRLQRR